MLVKITSTKQQSGRAYIAFDVIENGSVQESGEMLHLLSVDVVGMDYGSIDSHNVKHSGDYISDLAALTGASISSRISDTEAEFSI